MISPMGPPHHFPAYQARLGGFLIALLWCGSGQAAEWSNTEVHLQIGNLDVPSFAGGGSADHVIYTLQHASGWKYGDNFFFVDVLDSNRPGCTASSLSRFLELDRALLPKPGRTAAEFLVHHRVHCFRIVGIAPGSPAIV